ncbi:MAG: hypothetical protein K1X61_10980 [Chitinophagales bacterium]|nr:hypothetical protein [Chitinophagales bacterium]
MKFKPSSIFNLFFLLSGTIWMNGCTKGPGEGGTSTIKGKVFINDYNGAGVLQSSYYAPEERVYLIFGDDDFYGLDTRTSYDGTYEFLYLKKGSYTVFAYSDCDTCASTVEPSLKHIEITENHATVEVDDIILKK